MDTPSELPLPDCVIGAAVPTSTPVRQLVIVLLKSLNIHNIIDYINRDWLSVSSCSAYKNVRITAFSVVDL